MVHTHPPHHTLEGGLEHSSPYPPAHYHGHEPLHGQYTPSSHHNLYPHPHGRKINFPKQPHVHAAMPVVTDTCERICRACCCANYVEK